MREPSGELNQWRKNLDWNPVLTESPSLNIHDPLASRKTSYLKSQQVWCLKFPREPARSLRSGYFFVIPVGTHELALTWIAMPTGWKTNTGTEFSDSNQNRILLQYQATQYVWHTLQYSAMTFIMVKLGRRFLFPDNSILSTLQYCKVSMWKVRMQTGSLSQLTRSAWE